MINVSQMHFNTTEILKTNAKQILRVAFTLICISATIFTTVIQFMNYCTVEDQTIVTYKRFHESEIDVYPSISLCWTMAIDEEKLKRFDNEFTLKAYTYFLHGYSIGEQWNKDMLRVNYDNVTINFDDYIPFPLFIGQIFRKYISSIKRNPWSPAIFPCENICGLSV